ncbi:hypothetical protein JX266_014276 [Neoarthrinium moseri]|nr:hypothetical protein JX266_014276 [Neoarthrinium moseri]
MPAAQNQKVKMLEIGLGCDMSYGPGASYYAWLRYFPHVEIYYIEYDSRCDRNWADKTTGATFYFSDQGDTAVLQEFIDEIGGDFDIIIEHNGHFTNQQIVSFEVLWPVIKPGGIYFVENPETSHITYYGSDTSSGRDSRIETMANYVYELMDEGFQADRNVHYVSLKMRGIDCQRGICALFKKEIGDI